MFETINILAPMCMIFILLFGIFSSAIAKKNEHKVEIPEEYIGKENIYLQLRQHQWMMTIVYAEIMIILIWSMAIFFYNLFHISQQCNGTCGDQIIQAFLPFFIKLVMVLFSLLAAIIYEKKKNSL